MKRLWQTLDAIITYGVPVGLILMGIGLIVNLLIVMSQAQG